MPFRNIGRRTTATSQHHHKRKDFLLDGKPFQIISGEMHYARIHANTGATG